MREYFVSEKNYAEIMTKTVEPFLAALRREDFMESFDGRSIHYEAYPVENAKGVVVISHGFTESAEKFREMVYYFIKMGFAVFAHDHRGHGKSARLNNDPQTVAVGKFSDYVEDLHLLVRGVVQPFAGDKPLYLYCHSMGGAVGVQYLQEHPGVFTKAVLSAPMILCKCSGMPPKFALALTKAFCLCGKKDERVFVYKGFDPHRTYENSHDTSKARFDYYQAKRVANPCYQTASASYNWVVEAVKVAGKNLDPARCRKIDIPVLLCQPEQDASVYSEKEDAFIQLIPNGRLISFPESKHEIYASVDNTVVMYLDEIESFLNC